MNLSKYILLAAILCFTGCGRIRNFYPDQYNSGLSRFTSYGNNIMSAYINNTAYVNTALPFNYLIPNSGYINSGYNPIAINRYNDTSNNSINDTLAIAWQLEYSDTTNHNPPPYEFLSILIPVPKYFSLNDFFAWNGKIFPSNGITVTTQLINNSGLTVLSGTGSIYFVKIGPPDTSSTPGFILSGLFEGVAGNNQITKGRFDFTIYESNLNFR